MLAAKIISLSNQLPPCALAKIERIQKQDTSRVSVQKTRAAQRRELKRQSADARFRLASYQPYIDRGTAVKETILYPEGEGQPVKTRVIDPAIAEIRREISLLQKQIADLDAEKPEPCFAFGRIEQFLAFNLRAKFTEAAAITLPVPEGVQTPHDILTTTRAALGALKDQRLNVLTAPLPLADATAAAVAEVLELAAIGAPRVSDVLRGRGIGWPQTRLPETFGHNFKYVNDGNATVAWLFQEQLVARITEALEFEAACDPAAPMSAAEKAETLQKLDGEILLLERKEESIIETIEAEGGHVLRRPDADVRAVLGIEFA